MKIALLSKSLAINIKSPALEHKSHEIADKILTSKSVSKSNKKDLQNSVLISKSFQCKSAINSLSTFKSNRPDQSYHSVSSRTKLNTERNSPAFGETKDSFFYYNENFNSLKSVTETSNFGNPLSIARGLTPDRLDGFYLRSASLGDTENLRNSLTLDPSFTQFGTPILQKRRLESDDSALDFVRKLATKANSKNNKEEVAEATTPNSSIAKKNSLELDSKTRFFVKKILNNQNNKPPRRSATPLGISTQTNPANERSRSARPHSTSRSESRAQTKRSFDENQKPKQNLITDSTIFYKTLEVANPIESEKPRPSVIKHLQISSPENNFSFNQLNDFEEHPTKNIQFTDNSIETNHITRPSKKSSPAKGDNFSLGGGGDSSDCQINISSLENASENHQIPEKENNNFNLEVLFKLAEEKILQKINEDGLSPEIATNQFLQEFQSQLTANPRLNLESGQQLLLQQSLQLQNNSPPPKQEVASPIAQKNEDFNISKSMQFLGELEENDRLEIFLALTKDIDKIQDQEGYDSAITLMRELLTMIPNYTEDSDNFNQWRILEIDFGNKLGSYLYKKGEYTPALEELSKVLLIEPTNLSALYKIHEIHLKLGNKKEAKSILKQIKGNIQEPTSAPLEIPPENRNDYINTILEVDESFDSSDE